MNQYKYQQKQREESKRLAQIKKANLLEKTKKKSKNKSKKEWLDFINTEIARCAEKYMKDEITEAELYIGIKYICVKSMLIYGIATNIFLDKTFCDIINLKKAECRQKQIDSILED